MSKALVVVLALAFVACSAAAVEFTCTATALPTVTGESTVLGFGSNYRRQLGSSLVFPGETIPLPSPLLITTSTATFATVSGGFSHTAVIDSLSGKVYLAGSGSGGQLAGGPALIADSVSTFNSIGRMVDSTGLPAAFTSTVGDVALGWKHTCVLAQDTSSKGKVLCAGKNTRGQLGAASIATKVSLLVQTYGAGDYNNTNIVQIASGPDHVAAVDSTGAVWTWGAGKSGELGNGLLADSKGPVKVSLPAGVVASSVKCGFRYCLALSNDGGLYGWGINDQSQLLGTNPAVVSTPVLLATGVTLYAAGGSHVLAVIQGKLNSWGMGTMGQTGQPRNIATDLYEDWTIKAPTVVPGFAGVNVASIAAGMKHSVVLDFCGVVYAFGSDAFGQLGQGANVLGAAANYRSNSALVVSRVAERNVAPTAVFAGAYDSYVIGVNKPSTRK